MTIGQEGGVTAHPDHSMASMFATMAFHWASRKNRFAEQLQGGVTPHQAQKLYYNTALFTLSEREPVSLAPSSAVIALEPQEFETKIAAFKCHTSQAPLFPMFENTVRKRGHSELFHLVAAATPRKAETETDLFAGIPL